MTSGWRHCGKQWPAKDVALIWCLQSGEQRRQALGVLRTANQLCDRQCKMHWYILQLACMEKAFLYPYLASCVRPYTLRVIVFCYVKLCRWVGGSGRLEQTYCPYFQALRVKREKKVLLECLWIENEAIVTLRKGENHSYKDSSLHQGRPGSSSSPRCVFTSLSAASYVSFTIQLLLFSWSVANSASSQFVAH